MLNYQTLSINNFAQGLTDEYRSNGTRFNKLDNFIVKENGSIRLRNGMMPVANMVSDAQVRSLTMLGNDIVTLTGNKFYIKKDNAVDDADADLYTATTTSNLAVAHRWRNSVIVCPSVADYAGRIVKRSDGTYLAELASMPAVRATATNASSGITRLWAIALERTYVDADGFTYTEYSPEAYGSIVTAETGTISVSFSNVAYMLGTTNCLTNWNEKYSSLKLTLFLTKKNGTVLFRAKSIDAPKATPVTFSEINADALEANEVGNFFSEEPKTSIPKADYFCISRGTAWYASVDDGTGAKRYRVMQSVQGMPTSVLSGAYYDFDYPINGIADLSGTPIVLTDNAVFRIEGSIGIDGSGSIRAIKVSNSEGGISNGSMVVANDKLYYAGTDGFYVTDGYSAQNITGSELYKTYLEYTSTRTTTDKISGTFDRDNDIIYWSMGDGSMFALNSSTGGLSRLLITQSGFTPVCLLAEFLKARSAVAKVEVGGDGVLNPATGLYEHSFKVDSARLIKYDSLYTFAGSNVLLRITSVSVRPDANGYNDVKATSLLAATITTTTLYEAFPTSSQHLLIGTTIGHLMSMRDDYSSDVTYDSNKKEFPWRLKHKSIKFDMLTAGINYGASGVNKWVRDITANLKTRNKLSVVPYTIREDNLEIADMKIISNIEQFRSYDATDIWGRPTSKWYPSTVISGKRHMPKSFCKSRANQIGIKSGQVQLISSKDYTKGKVTAIDDGITPPTITIKLLKQDGQQTLFPFDVDVESRLYFVIDGVPTEFPVVAKSLSDDRASLTVAHYNGAPFSVNDLVDWVIEMYPIEQSFDLYGLDISFALLSNGGAGYKKANSLKDGYGD